MTKTIYSCNQGIGVILEREETEEEFFLPVPASLNNEKITPGTFTDFFGMFQKPIRYVGTLKGDGKLMCFCLGEHEDLFSAQTYYTCFYRLSETRIFNCYTYGTARDYNLKEGKWR